MPVKVRELPPPPRRPLESVEIICDFNEKESILVQHDESRASFAGITFTLLQNGKPVRVNGPDGYPRSEDTPHVCLTLAEAEEFANALIDLVETHTKEIDFE